MYGISKRIRKSLAYGFVGLCGVLFAAPAPAQELRDALIESFGEEIQALNAQVLDASVAHVHDDVVLYGLYSPFPAVGKAAFREAVREYFETHEETVLRPAHPKYLVSGSTGVAWGHYQLRTKVKGQQSVTSHGQFTFTYAIPGGEWQIISMHFAPLPIVE